MCLIFSLHIVYDVEKISLYGQNSGYIWKGSTLRNWLTKCTVNTSVIYRLIQMLFSMQNTLFNHVFWVFDVHDIMKLRFKTSNEILFNYSVDLCSSHQSITHI